MKTPTREPANLLDPNPAGPVNGEEVGRLTLTIPEAAVLLGIGKGLAYTMAAEGRLPTVRLGRRVLVPRAALSRWLDGERR